MDILTDDDIQRLLDERKPLPADYSRRMVAKPKRGHKESELEITGAAGSRFALIVRQSEMNPLDFSLILAYRPVKTNRLFRLLRYNGRHEHTNVLEAETFYDFHIHRATARYQERGLHEDTYAEPTTRYADYGSAIREILRDCSFDLPSDPQVRLFEEGV